MCVIPILAEKMRGEVCMYTLLDRETRVDCVSVT